jgi:hypothetical protein
MPLLLTLKRQDFFQKISGKLLFMVKETTILDHDLRSKPTDPTSGFAAVPVLAKSEEFHAVGGCCPSARDECIHPHTEARGKTFRQVIDTSFILIKL